MSKPGRDACYCGGEWKTIDSRIAGLPGALKRRRCKCLQCGRRITTFEIDTVFLVESGLITRLPDSNKYVWTFHTAQDYQI